MIGRRLLLGGGGSFTVSASDLGWYSVKDYGATGNGTTDDTAAIQATIDDAPDYATVFLPYGLYKITDELTVDHPLFFLGSGYQYGEAATTDGGTVVWQATADTSAFTCTQAHDAQAENGTFFEGLRITGPVSGTPTSGHGIYGLTDIYTNNVQVDKFWDGISLDDEAWYSRIVNTQVLNTAHYGIYLHNTNNTTLINVRVLESGGTGLGAICDDAAHGRSLHVYASSFENNNTYGMQIEGFVAVNLSGCYFEQFYHTPLADLMIGDTIACRNVTLDGCWFEGGNADWHIDSQNIDRLVISGGGLVTGSGGIRGTSPADNLLVLGTDLDGTTVTWAGTSNIL